MHMEDYDPVRAYVTIIYYWSMSWWQELFSCLLLLNSLTDFFIKIFCRSICTGFFCSICHFTMCKLFLAAADGEQLNSRGVQKSAWRSIDTCLKSDHCICFQKEGIWFGGLIKVSFSQQRQHPNPKVWNMDCGAAAAYHDVSYPFGSGRHKSINLAFSLSQKLILLGSQEVHKVITLFQIQKAVSLIISESEWWLLSEIKEKQPHKLKQHKGTLSLAPSLVIYLAGRFDQW